MCLSPTGVRTRRPPGGLDRLLEPAVRQHRDHQAVAVERPAAPAAPAPGSRAPGRRRPAVRSRRPRCTGRRRRRARSPRPRRARRTAAISVSGWVAPQSRLMLSPSGASWITVTRAPVARRISGPTRNAAPFAVSRTTCSPPPSIAAARPVRCATYRSSSASARDAAPDPRGRHARQLVGPQDQRLQLVLEVVVQLEAARVEHLEAVVLGRVVRRGDHDPGREVAARGEERQGRRRDDPDRVDVDAHARRPGGDRRHEHVARAPRVLAHDERAARADRSGGRSRGRGRTPATGAGPRSRHRGCRRCRTGGSCRVLVRGGWAGGQGQGVGEGRSAPRRWARRRRRAWASASGSR